MASPSNFSQSKRRFACDTDSDSEHEIRTKAAKHGIQDAWARFLLIEGTDEAHPLPKVSPFIVNKWLQGVSPSGFKSVKKLRSGALLVECSNAKVSTTLMNWKEPKIMNTPVKVSSHPTLNSSKGVIRCGDLKGVSEAVIRSELESQGVIDVHRVKITKDSKTVETSTLFLTFAMPKLPESIRVGYLVVKVTPYIPSPLRCFHCQRYGHSSRSCVGQEVCRNCGQDKHDDNCSRPAHCANCKGDHPANSKNCGIWKRECEIQKVKIERKCSFIEAKQWVSAHSQETSSSYANAARSDPSESSLPPSSVASLERKLIEFMSLMSEQVLALQQLVKNLVEKIEIPSAASLQQTNQSASASSRHQERASEDKKSTSSSKDSTSISPPNQGGKLPGDPTKAKKSSSSTGETPSRLPTITSSRNRSSTSSTRSTFGSSGFVQRRDRSQSDDRGPRRSGSITPDFTSPNRFHSLEIDCDSEMNG